INKQEGLKKEGIKNIILAKGSLKDLPSAFINDTPLNILIQEYFDNRKDIENKEFKIENEKNQLVEFVNLLNDVNINSVNELDDKVKSLSEEFNKLNETQKNTLGKYGDIKDSYQTFKDAL